MLNRGAEQGVLRPDVRPETAALILKTAVAGLAFVGLTEPERVDQVAAALCGQLETWLVTPSD
jgi:hypothetical protein